MAALDGKMCVLSTFKLNLVQSPALQNGDGNFMELSFSLNIFVPFAFTQITRVLKTASNSHFYWHGCYRSCPEKGWKDMTELATVPSHGVGISVLIQALLMNRIFFVSGRLVSNLLYTHGKCIRLFSQWIRSVGSGMTNLIRKLGGEWLKQLQLGSGGASSHGNQ